MVTYRDLLLTDTVKLDVISVESPMVSGTRLAKNVLLPHFCALFLLSLLCHYVEKYEHFCILQT